MLKNYAITIDNAAHAIFCNRSIVFTFCMCIVFFNCMFGHFQTLFNHVHSKFIWNERFVEIYDSKMHEEDVSFPGNLSEEKLRDIIAVIKHAQNPSYNGICCIHYRIPVPEIAIVFTNHFVYLFVSVSFTIVKPRLNGNILLRVRVNKKEPQHECFCGSHF